MARTSNPWQTPQVLFDRAVYLGMQRGINQLANAIRPTLGPLPRFVVDKNFSTERPEALDSGALIARRIIQLPDRQADVGAMYLRNMLWRLYETAGDGTATAAVLFQAIYNHGIRYIAAGGDAMRLRRYLEQGAQLMLELFERGTLHAEGSAQFAGLADSICYDHELSAQLGQIFEVIGPYGRLEIRSGNTRQIEHQFVEGSYWDGPLFSPHMITDQTRQRAVLENAAVLISNLEVHEPGDLIPAMEAALASEARALLLVVKTLPEAAMAVLLAPPNRARLLVAAAKTPGGDINATREHLEDLALLTGSRPLLQEAGDRLARVKPADLGRSRRAWADAEYFGIAGGRGDPAALREHVARVRLAYRRADEPRDRKRLAERLGQLHGGTAVLWVGALSPLAIDLRKEQARRTAEAVRGALREGVLPGGGVALLDCIPALDERRRAAAEPEERAAYGILCQACEAPIRALLTNAGLEPSATLADIRRAGAGHGFDVVGRQVADMARAGVLDSAAVVGAAVGGAIHSAALALTIDVLIHRASPPDGSIST
jgi:chaperonin GroEL